ncbi:hypothetical protein Scep_016610 [Stephania cephalantha]|uniref:Uncharacterized protein n=1 Tax=Stephania cephalantha TaxID=152367 RepID=A0AAP0IPW6_9MAGN
MSEVNEVTLVEDYCSEMAEELEVFQIELEIIIALDEEEKNEMKIKLISERSEESLIEIEEDQPLVLVKPPTLPCIFVKPYKGVEPAHAQQRLSSRYCWIASGYISVRLPVIRTSSVSSLAHQLCHAALFHSLSLASMSQQQLSHPFTARHVSNASVLAQSVSATCPRTCNKLQQPPDRPQRPCQ